MIKTENKITMDTTIWEKEISYLEEDDFPNASSTLLVSGEGIPTYKAYGVLFDGDSVTLEHVADHDMGSNFNEENLHNLEALKSRILEEEGKIHVMNEVNARVNINSLKGVFCVDTKDPTAMLGAYLGQRILMTKGYSVPLFVYNAQRGTLEHRVIETQTVETLLKEKSETNPKAAEAYRACLESL